MCSGCSVREGSERRREEKQRKGCTRVVVVKRQGSGIVGIAFSKRRQVGVTARMCLNSDAIIGRATALNGRQEDDNAFTMESCRQVNRRQSRATTRGYIPAPSNAAKYAISGRCVSSQLQHPAEPASLVPDRVPQMRSDITPGGTRLAKPFPGENASGAYLMYTPDYVLYLKSTTS